MTPQTAKGVGLTAARRINAQDLPCMRVAEREGVVTKPGDKVTFSHPTYGLSGHQRTAFRHLKLFGTYTVKYLVVNAFSSSVEFEEVPGVWFNHVLFSNV